MEQFPKKLVEWKVNLGSNIDQGIERWIFLNFVHLSRNWIASFRFGFSEFNSDTYAPISFKGIAPLASLSDDNEIKKLAEMVLTLQLFDFLHSSKGGR